MNHQEVWQAALGELELTLSKANFTTWFRNTNILSFEGSMATVAVPNAFTKTWFEKKYHSAILKALSHASSGGVKSIVYQVDMRPVTAVPTPTHSNHPITNFSAPSPVTNTVEAPKQLAPEPTNSFGLNPKYVFGNFIVGKQNEMAHAAAKAVTERPGEAYNPLFIYGGVGLGKTHLIQAIGNSLIEKNPQTRVLYISFERFINDFINAVRTGHAKEFKDHYRNVDLLLIDDIQFINGKKETQEEFFHTFNHLHQSNKQIVFTSDRPPKAIPALEDRLRSRFESGLMCDIGSPDLETRTAILASKCREKNFAIESKILNIIASTVTANIRELEGALIKIIANCQFKNVPPTEEMVRQTLQSFAPSAGNRSATSKQVLSTVALYFDIPLVDLLGASREKRLAHPRQVAMYLLREELRSSYPSIGMEVGGRDHTTAMHAYDKINRQKEEDLKLKQDIESLREKIYNS